MSVCRGVGSPRPLCRRACGSALVALIALSIVCLPLPGHAEAPIGEPFSIAAFAGDATAPAVAYNSSRGLFMVAWESGGTVTYRMLSEDGTLLDTPPAFNTSNGSSPDVAYSAVADEFLLVWSYYDSTAPGYDIIGARLSGDGALFLGSFVASAGRPDNEMSPCLAYSFPHDQFLVAWVDGYWGVPSRWDIYAARVAGSSGGPDLVGSPFLIATTGFNGSPDVAYNFTARDEYLVVWTRDASGGGGTTNLYGRRVPGTGLPTAAEAGIDESWGSQLYPCVESYAAVYTAPYLVVYRDEWTDMQGRSGIRAFTLNEYGLPTTLHDIAVSNGGQETRPAISANGGLGGYTIVWAQNNPATDADWDIWGRQMIGGVLQAPFNVSRPWVSIVGDNEQVPAVASGHHAAAVVWQGNSTVTTTGWDISGRLVAEAAIFTGNVYRGNPGDTSAPQEGVVVELYGDSDGDAANGTGSPLLATFTSVSGAYDLFLWPVQGMQGWFHIVETDPPGTVSTGAQALAPGMVNGGSGNVVTFAAPSVGAYRGSNFWDRATPPSIYLYVAPAAGFSNTNFRFDVSDSKDNEEATAALQVRWDWQNDGTWDTGWSTDKTATHAYHAVGDYTVRVEVRDSSLLSSTLTAGLTVGYGSLVPLVLHLR